MASKTLKASVLIGGSISSSLRSALGTTKDGLKQIGQAIADVERRQRLLGQSIQTFGRMGRNVDGLRRDYDELTRASERLRLAQTRLAAAQRAVDANMQRRSALGGQFMGAVGAAIGTGFAIGRPVMNAANFARENQLIGNTANMTRQEVAALGDTILRESRNTNQGANELQKAIGFLVAAGLDVKTAEASIRTIGRTTTAAGADIEDLSKASFTLIDALKITPTGLQGALDMLALAGKEGNVELKDMARQLPVLGASFVALKMNGTEAVATMGAALEVARKGAKDADEAANNMQNFMVKMMSPETLKKAQKNFGLDLYAIITKAQKSGTNPFEAAMRAIMKATGGDQKKIGELFQDMQVQAFLRPMIQNWDEYVRIKNKALNESAGTTDRDFALMMEQQAEQMKAAKIAADNLAKTYGATLLPAIGDAAGKLALVMDKVSAFVKENPKFVVGATKMVAGFVGLRVAALGLGYAWTFVKTPFLQVSAFIARFRAAKAAGELGRLGMAAVRVGGAFRWVATAVSAIGGGPIAIAVGALVAAALVVRKYWEPIKAFFIGMWNGFSEAVRPALGELMTSLQGLKPLWDAFGQAVGVVYRYVMDLLAPVNMTSEELGEAGRVGALVGAVIANSFKMTIQVVNALVKAIAFISPFIIKVGQSIVSAWITTWDMMKTIVGGAIDVMKLAIAPVVNSITWLAGKAAAIGSTVSGWWQGSNGNAGKQPQTAAAAGRAPPEVPSAAPSRSGAGNTTVEQSNIFHITQQPGESAEALARRITEEQRRAEQVKRRGSLVDD